ncbi:MAG: DUF5722 domain-containing protein [Eubacteriales bacterium]
MRKHPIAAIFFIFIMTAAALTLHAGAYDRVLSVYTDITIDSFEDGIPQWAEGSGTGAVGCVTALLCEPYEPYSGERSLAVMSPSSDISTARTVKRSFGEPLDLSGMSSFFFACNIPDISSAVFTVNVTLTSEKNGSVSKSQEISGSGWNEIICDISHWDGRGAITGITISVRGRLSGAHSTSYTFYIDSVGASTENDITGALRFMISSSNMYISGANTVYGDDGVIGLETRGEVVYIEPYSLRPELTEGVTLIALKLSNQADAKRAVLYYNTEGEISYSDDRCSEQALISGTQVVYFNVPQGIRQFRIMIDGIAAVPEDSGGAEAAAGKYITLYSLTSWDGYAESATPNGSITECSVSKNGAEVTLGITLSDRAYELYKGQTVDIYAIAPNESDFLITAKRIEPVATARVNMTIKLKFPLTAADGSSMLCDRFTAVINNADSPVALDSAYISNPENMSGYTAKEPTPATIKGYTSLSSADAALLGMSSTVIDIKLERLLESVSAESSPLPDREEYYFEGAYYYFDSAYAAQLKKRLSELYIADVLVRARLTVSKSSDDAVTALLCAPGADDSASYCAFNITDAASVSALRAVCSYIGKTFCAADGSKTARVSGIIVGRSVNECYESCNMGRTSLRDFTAAYTSALRIVALSVRAAAGNISIYIPVSDYFDGGRLENSRVSFDSMTFIDSAAAYIKQYGDFNWKLALEMNSSGALAPSLISNTGEGANENVAVRNFSVFCTYLTQSRIAFRTQNRAVTITAAQNPSSAAYAYSYYTLKSSGNTLCESFITSLPGISDELYGVIMYIDTPLGAEKTQSYPILLGYPDWQTLVPGYDLTQAAVREVITGDAGSSGGLSLDGSYALMSFDEISGGRLGPGVNISSLTADTAVMGRSGTLMLSTQAAGDASAWRGLDFRLDFPHDLTIAPYISFDAQITTLPEGVAAASLLLVVSSGRSEALYTAEIHESRWNTVFADISNLSFARSIDRVTIYIRSAGSDDIGDATLILTPITAMSEEYDSNFLASRFAAQRSEYMAGGAKPVNMMLVWALVVVIIVCSTLLTISLLTKTRRTQRPRR